jgi:hypothetical protein
MKFLHSFLRKFTASSVKLVISQTNSFLKEPIDSYAVNLQGTGRRVVDMKKKKKKRTWCDCHLHRHRRRRLTACVQKSELPVSAGLQTLSADAWDLVGGCETVVTSKKKAKKSGDSGESNCK